jgi:hypothetical protein
VGVGVLVSADDVNAGRLGCGSCFGWLGCVISAVVVAVVLLR